MATECCRFKDHTVFTSYVVVGKKTCDNKIIVKIFQAESAIADTTPAQNDTHSHWVRRSSHQQNTRQGYDALTGAWM